MSEFELLARRGWSEDLDEEAPSPRRPAPGKVTRTLRMVGGAHTVARGGASGAEGRPLPFGDRLQAAFGRHALGTVRAHVGPRAAEAAGALGARAYATGEDVVFAEAPDLFTAAHEAAHVVQQRRGVAVAGGVGAVGDVYERHADEVAAAVVAGRSAEALLDAAPGGGGASMAVQRQAVEPAVQLPGVTREVAVSLGQGDWKLDARLKVKLQAPAAVSVGGGDDLHAELRALEPKLTTRLNGFGAQLKAALVTSEFSLETFEGLALKLKVGGPEASVGADGFDVSVAKVGLVASGDVSHWIDQLAGTGLSGRIAMNLEVEGSFTIGGRLLGKLLEMDEVAKRLGKNFDELYKAADEIEDAARREKELVHAQRRAKGALEEAKRLDRFDVDGHAKALREHADEVERALKEQRRRLRDATARVKHLQHEVQVATKRLNKLERGVKGRVGKQVTRRMAKALGKRAAKVVAKFVPILNIVSTAADIYEVITWFRAWQKAGFELPSFDGGDEEGDGGEGAGGGGGADAGQGQGSGGDAPGGAVDVAGAPGGTGEGGDGRSDDGSATPGAGTVTTPAPGSDADAPHPRAGELVNQMRRGGGVALNREQVAAIARIVPRDLSPEQFDALRARLIDDGRGQRRKATDPYDLLAMVDEAVRDLSALTVTVTVDGARRDDLAPLSSDEQGPVTSPDHVDDPRRNPPHGARPSGRSSPRGGDEKRDAADVTESDVERRVTMNGGEPDVTRLVEWLGSKRGAKARGHEIESAEAVVTRGSRRWSLDVTIRFKGRGGVAQHFWLTANGRRVRAESYVLFDVTAGE